MRKKQSDDTSNEIDQRSEEAIRFEAALKALGNDHFVAVAAAQEYMRERAALGDVPFSLPEGDYASDVHIEYIGDSQTIVFEGSPETLISVILIHGGAFVSQVSPPNIAFCDKLAKAANATVYSPLYPLAPNHTCDEAYPLLDALYEKVLAEGKPIFLTGDSAGGGLAASFCMHVAKQGLPKPERAVLFSPWVDVSLSGDYDELLKVDPMLGADGLRCIGEAWAGDLSAKDWRVSPLFGDASHMPPTTLFVGTREILYGDVLAFRDKLEEAGIDVSLIVGKGMNHIWPFFPIPEAKAAFAQVLEALGR